MKKLFKKAFILALSAVITSQAYASGYKLEFQSPAVLADAGEAAVIDDASTNWYNSAGLVYLPQQLVAGDVQIYERSTFHGSASAPSFVAPPYFAQGKQTSYVPPNLPLIHYVLPFKNCWAFGISIVPAWGLEENWNETSFLRYDLIRIHTKTIDIAPSLAYKINNMWSVGAGPDFHYFSLQDKNKAYALPGATGDSISRLSANSWDHGFHIGVLFRPTETTRIGLNYRSKIVTTLDGYSALQVPGVADLETNDFRFRTIFPPVTTLSIYHDMNPCWALMGTIAYDQWSVLKAYNTTNYQSLPVPGNPSGLINPSLAENYSNVVDFSVGTHYKLNETWMLRGSLKLEGTPTNNQTRNIENPDAPKLGINVGAHYTINKKFAVDVIYAHVFTSPVHINYTNPITASNANGHVNTAIDLVGAQLVWNI